MARWALAVTIATIVTPAWAQDAAECFSPATHTNVCEIARKIQPEIASQLPAKISQNVALMSVMALGPRLNFSVMWSMTKAEFDERLRLNSATVSQIAPQMEAMAQNGACSSKATAAFIRLGGRIVMAYRTTDNFAIHDVTVSSCP